MERQNREVKVTVLPPTVVMAADPRGKAATWTLMPAPPGVCSQCAKDHEPELPHDWQTLHWQYAFYAEYGRWPVIDDAFTHCTSEVHEAWRVLLLDHGVQITPRAEEP